MVRNKLCIFWWSCWIVGFALVAGSWVNLVTVQIGWIGWGIGMLGVIGSRIPALNQGSSADKHPEQSDGPDQTTEDPSNTSERDH